MGEAMDQLPEFKNKVEWQIDRRYRIQQLLFELHQFLKANKDLETSHDDHWHAIGRLVAAAFSLWRSAFLTSVKRKRKDIYKHMVEFVDKVVTHNSITFADDHRMCELTVDYYNSNARYRLERMMKGPYLRLAPLQTIEAISEFDVGELDQQQLWDLYFRATYESFGVFKTRWLNAKKAKTLGKRRSTAGGRSSGRQRPAQTPP